MSTRLTDGPSHGLAFMAAEIIDDDNVAGLQCWNEHFCNVEEKALAIDGTIDEPGRFDAIMPKRCQERQSVPMAIGGFGRQAPSFWRPTAQRRHIGFGPSLVDEDEAGRFNARLIAHPLSAPSFDVGAILFAWQKRFFCS